MEDFLNWKMRDKACIKREISFSTPHGKYLSFHHLREGLIFKIDFSITRRSFQAEMEHFHSICMNFNLVIERQFSSLPRQKASWVFFRNP